MLMSSFCNNPVEHGPQQIHNPPQDANAAFFDTLNNQLWLMTDEHKIVPHSGHYTAFFVEVYQISDFPTAYNMIPVYQAGTKHTIGFLIYCR